MKLERLNETGMGPTILIFHNKVHTKFYKISRISRIFVKKLLKKLVLLQKVHLYVKIQL